MQIRNNQYFTTSVYTDATQVVNQYWWTIYGADILSGQGTQSLSYKTANATGRFSIQVKVGNACGWNNNYLTINGTLIESIPHIALFPNPANTSVEVSIVEDKASTQDSTDTNVAPLSAVDITTTNYATNIYNSFGNKVYTSKRTGSRFSLPVNNLKEGTYIIEVSDGKNSYRNQLIVKH